MEIKDPKKTLRFDPEKASELLSELIEVYQKHKPSVGEILIATSNLLYSLGSSMSSFYGEKIEDKGPSIEELNKIYYSEPGRIDVAMMLQAIMLAAWHSDWEKLQTQQDIKEKV